MSRLSRRHFIVVAGTALGGIALGVPVLASRRRSKGADPPQPSAFLQIEPDGTIIVTVPRPEMGQGVRTALPMLVAEELDADWSRVRVREADLDEARYGPQFTGGSAVVRTSWEPLRRAVAAARAMLVAAAAAQWGVPVVECRTERSEVLHPATSRRTSYGALAVAARALPVPRRVPLKDPSTYTIIGHSTPNVDVPAIVRGAITFGIDVRVPGMVFASIERSPICGGRLARL